MSDRRPLVFYLDEPDSTWENCLGEDLAIRLLTATDVGISDTYRPPDENQSKRIGLVLDALAQIRVIVIGNNMGAGIAYVKAIPQEKRGIVIVLHNDDTDMSIKELEYREMGVNRICPRSERMDALRTLIG